MKPFLMGIFTEEILKDSSYYQELVEIGREAGRQEVRQQIRELVASRFGSEDHLPDLDRVQSFERLYEIFKIALKAESAAEIKKPISAF